MIEITLTDKSGDQYSVSNETIKVGDWVFAKYTNGSIRIFQLRNKRSDLNDFYTTNTKENVYWKITNTSTS